MTDLIDRLSDMREIELSLADDCDCRPEDTQNWQNARTLAEAIDRLAAVALHPAPVAYADRANLALVAADKAPLVAWRHPGVEKGRSFDVPLYATPQAHPAASEPPTALARLMPLIEKGMRELVFTGDKASEVAADMQALRAWLATPQVPPAQTDECPFVNQRLQPGQDLVSNLQCLAGNPQAAYNAFGLDWMQAVANSALDALLAHPAQTAPLMLNGLTEAETAATASVAGLVHLAAAKAHKD